MKTKTRRPLSLKSILLTASLLLLLSALGACDSLGGDAGDGVGTGQLSELETVYIGAILPGAGAGAPQDSAEAEEGAAKDADAAQDAAGSQTAADNAAQPENSRIGNAASTATLDYEAARQARIAMELAADIINNRHDLDWDIAQSLGLANYGHARIELVFRDSGTSAESAAEAATELIGLGVPLLIGAVDPELTAAAAAPSNLHGVPLLCGSAQDAALTDGSYRFAATFNRIAVPDSVETALFLDYLNQMNLTKNAGIKKIAVAYADNELGRHTLEVLEAALAKTNLQVVARVTYQPGAADLSEEASRVIMSEPDAVFQISGADNLINFANFYAAAKFQPTAVFCYSEGFAGSRFAALTQEKGLDFYFGAMVCPDLHDQSAAQATDAEAQLEPAGGTGEPDEAAGETQASDSGDNDGGAEQPAQLTPEERRQLASGLFAYLNGLYRERAGVDMSNAALLEFAAVIVAAQAVDMAGTCDTAALNALLKSAAFPAPYLYSGSIVFDAAGQNSASPEYVARLLDGRYAYVD